MKYLVVGPSWVGDMVMAQTLFISIRQKNPDAIIDVLAPAWSRPILDRMPEVRQSIDMPLGHGSIGLGIRRKLGKSLITERYDQSIVLPNSLKSALVPFFANIPQRTGWRGEMRYGLLNDIRTLDKERYPLMIERFIALAGSTNAQLSTPLPRPALQTNPDNKTAALKKYALSRELPILALCPGAEFGPAKRWPESHYAEVAQQKLEQGWQVWLFGSAKDQTVTDDICRQVSGPRRKHVFNLAGQTSLADAIDLLATADAVVSNDSGLMHIAAALSRNLVVVYGSTSPGFTPPLNDNCSVVRLDLECSPCFKRECPLEHLNCLKQLPPETVLDALDALTGSTIGRLQAEDVHTQ